MSRIKNSTAFKLYIVLAVMAVASFICGIKRIEAATMTKGYTFSTNEIVTAAKLHSLVDDGTISAITSADITDGTISSDDLGANSVVTGKILDGTITGADLANGTISSGKYGTNSIPAYALATNQTLNAGSWDMSAVSLFFATDAIASTNVAGAATSSGVADAGKVLKLSSLGKIDGSFLPFTGTNQQFNCAADITLDGNATNCARVTTLKESGIVFVSANVFLVANNDGDYPVYVTDGTSYWGSGVGRTGGGEARKDNSHISFATTISGGAKTFSVFVKGPSGTSVLYSTNSLGYPATWINVSE